MNLPGSEDRTLVIGRTGSGKTGVGLWLLSKMDYDFRPWYIVDFKRDKNIAQIPFAQYRTVRDELARQPGIYIVQPMPQDDDGVTDFFNRIWETEGIGIYIDEGVMVAKNDALDNILIQGRSKEIPVIMLTQRPVGISRFAFSESNYFVVFPSHDKRERKIISEFTPLWDASADYDDVRLPTYHFYYYDVLAGKISKSKPVPFGDAVYNTIYEKLKPEDEQPILAAPAEAPRKRFTAL